MANLFVLKRQFCSSPVHMRHTNERLQNFIVKPSCSLKRKRKKSHRWKKFSKFLLFLLKPSCSLKKKEKKVIAGNQGAIRHRLATSDIPRYKWWKIFHLKFFPNCNARPLTVQCAAGWPPCITH